MTPKTLSPLDIPSLLRKYDIRPSRGLGQNFLQDTAALQKIVAAAGITSADDVLEIGPGLGSLTRFLAQAAGQVVAVELDQHLLPPLKDILVRFPNVRIVHGDILDLPASNLGLSDGYVVVANIPYYITSAVIRRLLEGSVKPHHMLLTVQKEVAARICAIDGKMSLLSLSVQVYGKPSIVDNIPAESFYPSPKVDSSVLRIELYPQPLIPSPLLDNFFTLIKAGFSQKRKTLRNSLSAGLRMSPAAAEDFLAKGGIDPRRRAETLSLDEWGKLSALLLRTGVEQ